MTLIVSKEKYKERINICLTCKSYDETFHRCEECGCFLLAKAFLAISSCPLQKWTKDSQQNPQE